MADDIEKPPLLPSWNAWYALVLGMLIVVIAIFTLLTSLFS